MSDKFPIQTVNASPLAVEVSLPERVVVEKDAVQSMRRLMGVENVQEALLSDLEAIGIYLKGAGLKIQRTRVLVNQQFLADSMVAINRMLREVAESKDKLPAKINKIAKLTHAQSEVSQALTKAGHLAVEIDTAGAPHGRPPEENEPENVGFLPNRPVRPPSSGTLVVGQEIHMHQPAEKK